VAVACMGTTVWPNTAGLLSQRNNTSRSHTRPARCKPMLAA